MLKVDYLRSQIRSHFKHHTAGNPTVATFKRTNKNTFENSEKFTILIQKSKYTVVYKLLELLFPHFSWRKYIIISSFKIGK